MEAKDKAQEAMRRYTSGFAHDVLSSEAIAQQLVQYRQNEEQHQPHSLLLVDVRSEAEMAVSMIPGSISREEFEKRQVVHRDDRLSTNVTVVPYCTVGYRSGRYCDQLVQRGFPPHRVKYGEGIVLWTHLPGATLVTRRTPRQQRPCGDGTPGGSNEGEEQTRRCHTFGADWAHVGPHFEPVYFSPWEVVWRGVRSYFFG
jgi:rhodanese-related sulfurtransferase